MSLGETEVGKYEREEPVASSSSHQSRNVVGIGREIVTDVAATDFPGHWPNEDHSWNEEKFKKNLVVKIGRLAATEMEFDIVGVDASVANAIRRVLIAEVPTIAIENVYIWLNTSIVQDEVLSQRLGLVPLHIDPRKVDFKGSTDEPTDLNTVVFSLNKKCEFARGVARNEANPEKLYKNSSLYSSAFEWQPKGVQAELFKDNPPRPVLDDILLAKLRPGQEILMEMHCEKGIGKDHAKWSPVATASYRLLPLIKIKKPINPALCEKFAASFPPGVIEVKNAGSDKAEVVVANPRKDTVSREVLRHPEFEDSVVLGRYRDHFIFNVESVGQYAVEELLPEALAVLRTKVQSLRASLSEVRV